MEKHREKILKVCRLCRKKINLNKGYKNPKNVVEYQNEINVLFGYDVSVDVPGVHPPCLCDACRRQLGHVNLSFNYVQNDIAVFKAHSDNCELCITHKLPKQQFSLKKIDKVELSLDAIKEIGIENGYVFCESSDATHLVFVKHSHQLGAVVAEQTLKVYVDFSWKLFIFDKEIPPEKSPFLQKVPRQLTRENMSMFFSYVIKGKVCCGNNDFTVLLGRKMEDVKDIRISQSQSIEDERLNNVDNFFKTIRSNVCEFLIEADCVKCINCQKSRPSLRKLQSRHKVRSGSVVKAKRPHSSLNKKQLRKRLFDAGKEKKNLKRKVVKLEKQLESETMQKGLCLDNESHNLVNTIVNDHQVEFKEDSPMFLLWKQQKKMASLKRSTMMRWHPVLIRWALSIYLRSPGTYEHIRQSGFIKLPHRTTLNQYTNFTDIKCGYNPDVIERFLIDIKFDSLPQSHRCCSLLFDEMKIQSGLVFNSKSGRLIGFTDLGDINKEMDDLVVGEEGDCSRPLATHVLSVMARGLIARFNYPIGYFASTTVSADQLFPIMWEGVRTMQMVGMRVEAFISDGASQNRRFYEMHMLDNKSNVSTDGVVYWILNRYDLTSKIYFFSDTPHLIKTLRNNLERSNGFNGSRKLMIKGKSVSWAHIKDVYEWDLHGDGFSPGLRKLHKITHDHIYLSPRLRMRVNLAAQVLSKTMADTLSIQGYEATQMTQKFVRLVDQFFDCLNVNQTYIGKKSLKNELYPYSSTTDWRFEWLENVFLAFINDWKKETDQLTMLPKKQRARFCLSYQTIQGIRMTVHSFNALVPKLLSQPDVEYFLSDRLNQDPLEEHFGKQRMKGGGIDNPTLEDFMYNERKIIVAKSDMIRSLHGNTRGRKREAVEIDINDDKQLPKRKKK